MIRKNIPTLIIAGIILLLSLGGSGSLGKINFLGIKHADKIVHSIMYFVLTAVLLYQNRSIIDSSKKLIALTIMPLLFGSLIELLQSWLTTTRRGDIFDLLFNFIGIVVNSYGLFI